MYAHEAHIPQPPHSAGMTLQGLRTHIDPSQVPSPVDAIEADRDKWEKQAYMTLPGNHVPLSTTDYVAIDQGNSSPKFIRMSTWNIPSTSRLAKELDIPIVAVIQPFSDIDPREENIPLIECGESGPQRCSLCRGYINAWCTWTVGGNKWKCNLCGHETEVTPDYFCNLDANLLRLDHEQRPELNKGTVDFAVSEEYWAPHPPTRLSPSYFSVEPPPSTPNRKPQPMTYLFVLDVSQQAVHSGFLRAACASLRSILYGGLAADEGELQPCFPPESRLGIITYDHALHFYDFSPELDQARLLVVSDIDEVFLPSRDGLLVNPHEFQTAIEGLLKQLPGRFDGTMVPQSCLGSALRAALASLAGRGGQVVVFQARLPTIGSGALEPRLDESKFYDTDKERSLYTTRDTSWQNVAEELAEEGVGVSMFLGMREFIDVGSIGVVASITGGELFFHPLFDPIADGPILDSQFRRLMSRTTGLRVANYYGNFSQRTTTDLEFGTLDADKAVSVLIEHSHTLDERQYAFLQCALLYTTVAGQRRVRVCNLALQVVALAGTVFRFADMDTLVVHMLRHSISQMPSRKMSLIRDELTEMCSAILYSYRRNCAASTGASQLIIPEAFRALPMYSLAIHKSKPLKARNVSSDVRNFHAHRLSALSVRATMFYLYPRLLAIHDLDDQIALPNAEGWVEMPSLMRASHLFMETHGIYLIDNEEMMVFWIGAGASPQLLLDLFGVDDFVNIDPHTSELPVIESRLSAQIRNIVARRRAERGGRALKMFVARQNVDAAELEFSDMLVEDHNNASLSYLDYLSLVHKQIAAAMQNGGSLSSSASVKAIW
ncbi:hypothetical protein EW146_g9184 [Bondarzewia mesenterica]|uniref:Sec23/Sec24 trunk domain-containing protein n=1 Tax=Bondarzewia mesenterica TaxID=1095465 RepID=A0A4S4L8B6_9AGAM|nr:hypothetical protein EW146_g9184 [Bondarzewia mesenterica]